MASCGPSAQGTWGPTQPWGGSYRGKPPLTHSKERNGTGGARSPSLRGARRKERGAGGLTCPLLQQLCRGVGRRLRRTFGYFLQRICRKEQENAAMSPACLQRILATVGMPVEPQAVAHWLHRAPLATAAQSKETPSHCEQKSTRHSPAKYFPHLCNNLWDQLHFQR